MIHEDGVELDGDVAFRRCWKLRYGDVVALVDNDNGVACADPADPSPRQGPAEG